MLSRVLEEIREKLHQRLVEQIKENITDTLANRAIEAVELKEDYERGLFVRLGYQSLNKDWEKSIDAMASLELLDSSLLIVDDIFDDAPRRMGKATIHKAWGSENAIMLANMLKSTSIIALAESVKLNGLTSIEFSELLKFFEKSYNDMYFGEYLDISYESMPFENVSVDDYLEMIKRTTGFHFAMATKAGGLLAKGNQKQVKTLWEIGVRAGMILQIRDDFIDYLDMEDITHKPAFGDFERNKKRLPLILAYKFFPEKVKQIQNTTLNNSKKKKIQMLISDDKIRSECQKIIKNIYSDTDILINSIKSTQVREILLEFFNLIRRV